MLCEKCQQLNDAMCVKCINCGNTLIEITQKDHAEHPSKEKNGPMHSIIVVAGIFIPYQIFEYFVSAKRWITKLRPYHVRCHCRSRRGVDRRKNC